MLVRRASGRIQDSRTLQLRSASLTNTSTPSISGMTRSRAMCVGCHSSTAWKNSTVVVMNRAVSPTDSAMSCTILPMWASSSRINSRASVCIISTALPCDAEIRYIRL